MNLLTNTNPYARIREQGRDVEVRRADDGYLVYLTCGTTRLAGVKVRRSGALTMPEVRQKIEDGRWGRSSDMHIALAAFAAQGGAV